MKRTMKGIAYKGSKIAAVKEFTVSEPRNKEALDGCISLAKNVKYEYKIIN